MDLLWQIRVFNTCMLVGQDPMFKTQNHICKCTVLLIKNDFKIQIVELKQ